MRLITLINLTTIMFFGITVAGIAGTYLWTPVNVDISQQSEKEIEEFHRVHPVATTEELDRFYNELQVKYSETPPETSFAVTVQNAIVWRPWLAFLSISLCLLLMRPSALYTVSSGAVVVLTLGLFGVPLATWGGGAVLTYLIMRLLFFKFFERTSRNAHRPS